MEISNLLIRKFLANSCTAAEAEQVAAWLKTHPKALDAFLKEDWDHAPGQESLESDLRDAMWQAIRDQTTAADHQRSKIIWMKWAAVAASVLAVLAIGYGLFYNNNKEKDPGATKTLAVKDFAPGGNRAILTLADGSAILLDSVHNGILSQQGNTRVLKLNNGELAYHSSGEKPGEVQYNTIATPKGGQYQVILADGTKVWLNAASSLHFPTSFAGRERRVEITGEAYFEVAHNAAMPFIVKNGDAEVRVLGTHFNINAYNDESAVKVTLLEGQVNVTQVNAHRSQLLSPGQQASMHVNSDIKVNGNVDMEAVMAWKNGLFNFTSADIKTIMRQVGRWYDIDVSYEGNLPEREFSGKISRNTNASNVLKILEQSNIHFRMENKKIIVMP